uniref:FAD/NAD(P)-binding domain-containing protein n=1 Tax=Amphora coffeiformis TaxID=265554 RepID=A0A7S3P881_9STRA|mmetsp:Transcript_5812/g.11368  ORF Transcript_5812/g.11368 Transcript_5812/m.11368 type:complete len:467 (+) Transcript_5812:99-1499(+)|eukprot:scaffold4855_cov195-Amphora_coffeaeformis.AAC.13
MKSLIPSFSTTALMILLVLQQRSISLVQSFSSHTPQRVVIVGGGIGGLSSAFDAHKTLQRGKSPDQKTEVVVVSDRDVFSFTPSNPWIAVGKRQPSDIQLDLATVLPRHDIGFIHSAAEELFPTAKKLKLKNGDTLTYDYLIIATGPRLGNDIPGLKEHGQSVCTTPHAQRAYETFEELCANPGPVVIGATQGASCFGPAYEYAFLLQHALLKRGGKALVEKCPITFVTAEPQVGHLGLNGAGNSKTLMPGLLKERNISYFANARVLKVTADSVHVEKLDFDGKVIETHEFSSRLTMFIPAFSGHDVWKKVPHLTDPKGMILVNEHQQSPAYPGIFGVGACVAIPNEEVLTIPIGIPKTGYLIESQGTAAVENIHSLMHSKAMTTKAALNALCITDFGDDGAVFVTLPQIPPRRFDWTIHSKAIVLAKIAFEKYFLHKIETGDTDPYYEKYLLKLVGVDRIVHEYS